MALLDVSDVLLDPDFTDFFSVRRRFEKVDIQGRSQIHERIFPNLVGVITAGSPSDLDRQENYQNMSRSLTIVCQFPLRGETTNYQPDVVVWKGSNYLVKHVDLYPQFGKGFYQAECSSMNKTDRALNSDPLNGLEFNQDYNSQYLFKV